MKNLHDLRQFFACKIGGSGAGVMGIETEINGVSPILYRCMERVPMSCRSKQFHLPPYLPGLVAVQSGGLCRTLFCVGCHIFIMHNPTIRRQLDLKSFQREHAFETASYLGLKATFDLQKEADKSLCKCLQGNGFQECQTIQLD